ncbi:hypothetical protein HK100_003009 [Physocladia obscura]|uniref:Small ribosomal subunit protein mS35 mitochondrial conserved domain-containing protein n=1 Tax=Physocladia obscura TaxID=109957 RepID=A0AAD5T9P7_9FUNG|nr:hypothetical protein HK100_003009 [Physocladia obscura]
MAGGTGVTVATRTNAIKAALGMHVRALSVSASLLARRRMPAGAADQVSSGPDDVALRPLTGKWEVDGLHRYELDLLETADWTTRLLRDLSSYQHTPTTKSITTHSATAHQTNTTTTAAPKTASNSTGHRRGHSLGLAIRTSRSFDFELEKIASNGDPSVHPVVLQVLFDKLSPLLPSAQAKHKFLVLAAENYDGSAILTFSSNPANESQRSLSFIQRRLLLLATLRNLINEANKTDENFDDIPINLRRIKKSTRVLSFPKEWKQPKSKNTPAPSSSPLPDLTLASL